MFITFASLKYLKRGVVKSHSAYKRVGFFYVHRFAISKNIGSGVLYAIRVKTGILLFWCLSSAYGHRFFVF